MKKWKLFNTGTVLGLVTLSLAWASVSKHTKVTDDTALYQNLSEIRVPKAAQVNFDSDISKLSQLEVRYKEKLPDARLASPMKRISQKKYQFSGKKRTVSKN